MPDLSQLSVNRTKQYAVSIHPKCKDIEKAILEGIPIIVLSKKYGISRSAITRYRDAVMLKRIAAARQIRVETTQTVANATKKRAITDAQELFDIILSAVERMRKLSDACDEYLQDPDDVSRYLLTPQGHEIFVVLHRKTKDGKRIKEKKPLSVLLERLEQAGYSVDSLQMNATDPRILLVKASEALTRQMDSMVGAWKSIEDQRTNFSQSAEWRVLVEILQDIISRHPEERDKIASRINTLA